MPARRALAFWHNPEPRVRGHAEAFAAGARLHGVPCEILHSSRATEAVPGVDVVWHYGLGEGGLPFRTYGGKAARVGGDAGVWRRLTSTKFIRISVEGPQLGALMNRRAHDFGRFEALKIPAQPKPRRGDYILVTGRSKYDAAVHGQEYGVWERAIFDRLRTITTRPIVFRPKPKNDSVPHPGIREEREPRDCNLAILGAHAVVCRSGNIGADAILLNVPVWAESGPGAVYRAFELEDIDRAATLEPDVRRGALADIAAWQWTDEEIRRGELWAHLRDEGVI